MSRRTRRLLAPGGLIVYARGFDELPDDALVAMAEAMVSDEMERMPYGDAERFERAQLDADRDAAAETEPEP